MCTDVFNQVKRDNAREFSHKLVLTPWAVTPSTVAKPLMHVGPDTYLNSVTPFANGERAEREWCWVMETQ